MPEDILSAIDQAVGCQHCGGPSSAGDFCSAEHQSAWFEQHVDLIDYDARDAASVREGRDEARWSPPRPEPLEDYLERMLDGLFPADEPAPVAFLPSMVDLAAEVQAAAATLLTEPFKVSLDVSRTIDQVNPDSTRNAPTVITMRGPAGEVLLRRKVEPVFVNPDENEAATFTVEHNFGEQWTTIRIGSVGAERSGDETR